MWLVHAGLVNVRKYPYQLEELAENPLMLPMWSQYAILAQENLGSSEYYRTLRDLEEARVNIINDEF